jgi:VanZ family protein
LLCGQLSLALELAQLYTPTRVASLWDLLLNVVGGAAGALAAPVLLRLGTGLGRPALADRFALLLLACWLMGRLHPYVPTLDLGEWRASLAPLLREPLDAWRALRIAVLWWLAGRLTEAAFPRAAWLVPPLVLATLAAAVPIAARALGWADVAGGLGGLLLWALLRRVRLGDALLVPAMVAVVLAEGLAPYAFLSAPRDFSFVPFASAIGGSFGAGMQAILYKTLLFGGLLWALLRLGAPFAPSLGFVLLLTLAVSIAQRWLPGRSAEITDALIALAAGLAARLTAPQKATGGAGLSPAPPPPRRSLRSHRPRGRR